MNLKINFSALTKIDKIYYLLFKRFTLSKQERFFFEGKFILPGQLYAAERKALYDTVISEKPDYCIEIGTYTGGGSTYFISEALKVNDKGKLITTEIDEFLWNKAKRRYQKYISKNIPFVEFIHSDNLDVFAPYIKQSDKKTFYFFDGAENSLQTFDQFNYFKEYYKNGDIVAFHDWNTDKAASVKPLIINDKRWNIIKEIVQPDGIGMAIFKYKI